MVQCLPVTILDSTICHKIDLRRAILGLAALRVERAMSLGRQISWEWRFCLHCKLSMCMHTKQIEADLRTVHSGPDKKLSPRYMCFLETIPSGIAPVTFARQLLDAPIAKSQTLGQARGDEKERSLIDNVPLHLNSHGKWALQRNKHGKTLQEVTFLCVSLSDVDLLAAIPFQVLVLQGMWRRADEQDTGLRCNHCSQPSL